jgi:hypothetical protein
MLVAMRRLVLILLTFIAVITFIRVFDDVNEIGRAGEVESERTAVLR